MLSDLTRFAKISPSNEMPPGNEIESPPGAWNEGISCQAVPEVLRRLQSWHRHFEHHPDLQAHQAI